MRTHWKLTHSPPLQDVCAQTGIGYKHLCLHLCSVSTLSTRFCTEKLNDVPNSQSWKWRDLRFHSDLPDVNAAPVTMVPSFLGTSKDKQAIFVKETKPVEIIKVHSRWIKETSYSLKTVPFPLCFLFF